VKSMKNRLWVGIRLVLVVLVAPAVALASEAGASIASVAVEWLAPVVLALGGAMGTWLANESRKWVAARVENERIQALLGRAGSAVAAAVSETTTHYVADLKSKAADGKLTKEEAEVALQSAFDRALENLGPKGVALGKQVLGEDLADSAWLVSLIEAEVARRKAVSK
jgi:hypothetical protein